MKKWLINTLSLVLISLFIIGLFNYVMDPMWTFEHKHSYNQYQRASKERQQKSHAIYFQSRRYNTLLLGSSRTTFMDQRIWFEKDDTFNYAVSDIQPQEYISYIKFAINEAKQPIKRVILGLDFFGALEYAPLISTKSIDILSPITQHLYRWKLLFSFGALDYSIKNINYYLKKRSYTYNRDNQKHMFISGNRAQEQYKRIIAGDLEEYKRNRYSTAYDNGYKNVILQLKKEFPHIEFIIYTTPVSFDHFRLLIETDQYENYERWLKESAQVFGTVHHFMYLNQYTDNSETYFVDSNHPREEITKCIAEQVQGIKSNCQQTDFVLHREQINLQLQTLKQINRFNDPS